MLVMLRTGVFRLPNRPARALALLLATTGACLAATGAEAQSARYMTWANRPASTTPAGPAPAAAEVAAVPVAGPPRLRNDLIPRRVAPSQGPGRPAMQTVAAATTAGNRLTPASAWLGPRTAPAFAPGVPDPTAYATDLTPTPPAAAPVPVPVAASSYVAPPSPYSEAGPAVPAAAEAVPAPPAADPMAPRRDAAIFSLRRPEAQAPTDAAQAAPADPMAPRPDARIFQPAPASAPQQQAALPVSAEAGPSRARYYSVHRDAGRQPDRTPLPEPVYFDSVSVDLAEPPALEPPLRDAQGRRRAVADLDPSAR